jgi:mitochondrial inner membrane protein COX18
MVFLARPVGLGGRFAVQPHLRFPARTQHHLLLSGARLSQLKLRQHNPSGTRHFTVASAVESAIVFSQHAFIGVHAVTGLPWFVTIPMVALTVNLFTRGPITLFIHRRIQQRATLVPLLRALYVRHSREVAKEMLPPAQRRAKIKAKFDKSSKEVYAAWGVQNWKNFTNFAVFPFWLAVMEGLRRLCGAHGGLLSLLLYGPPKVGPTAVAASGTELLQPGSLAENASGADLVSGGLEHVPDLASQSLLGLEPSLTSGGCLWFTDLTVADPLHVLPFLLSLAMFANIVPTSRAGWDRLLNYSKASSDGAGNAAAIDTNQWSSRLQRGLLVLSLAVGPATMNLPAALHLYWISSATFSLLYSQAIKALFPATIPAVQPCKGAEMSLVRPQREAKTPKGKNSVR